jgi:response regulator RpfG family c-di-GMP phosphodiesterase
MNYLSGFNLFQTLKVPKDNIRSQILNLHELLSVKIDSIDAVHMAAHDDCAGKFHHFTSSTDDENLTFFELINNKNLQEQLLNKNGFVDYFVDSIEHDEGEFLEKYSFIALPISSGDSLIGTIFLMHNEKIETDNDILTWISKSAEAVVQIFKLELMNTTKLAGAITMASDLAVMRDMETGNHLHRISEYSALIANKMAKTLDLDDEFIEYVRLFAPLHDVGKLGVPDSILLKPGPLNDSEWKYMKSHVDIGVRLTEQIIINMGLSHANYISIMKNIVSFHHERGDGSGYPYKLKMHEIPLEAKIVAVADVYDALASKRSYKEAWPEAMIRSELMQEVNRGRLDRACVEALLSSQDEVNQINKLFSDD